MINKEDFDHFEKKHSQSRYFTIMLIPDATNSQVRSLKVPRRFLNLLVGIAAFAVALICGLSVISAYSQKSLVQTAKLIEESETEKKSAQSEKMAIEKSLISQRGDFNKQIELYMDRILEIEAKLVEIEKAAAESYGKMNAPGSPISKKTAQTFMGGSYMPVFEKGISNTDKLNRLIETVSAELVNTERLIEEYSADVNTYTAFMEHVPNMLPVAGVVTSEQGSRADPITGAAANHSGIDIKAQTGTGVRASGGGTVVRSEYSSGYGNLIIIDHGYGLQSYYAHNSELLVNKGDTVKRGDIIAKSGNTGRTTGPHVHYEVRHNGVIKNPRDYLGK